MIKRGIIAIVFLFIGITVNAQDANNKEAYKITDSVQNEGWLNDANVVFKQAEENKSTILMNFTGTDWCVWCKKIKKEIFNTPEFKAWVKKENIILFELDFPRSIPQTDELKAQNRSFAQKLGIRGYPTIVMVIDGKAVKVPGYVAGGPKAWISAVESQLNK